MKWDARCALDESIGTIFRMQRNFLDARVSATGISSLAPAAAFADARTGALNTPHP
jgi:hypothetical protein